MVVLGAGASYDSAPSFRPLLKRVDRFRPPLANELFDKRDDFALIAQRYSRVLPIIPLLQDLKGRSVEEILEQLQTESAGYIDGQRHLAAVRYYIRDVLTLCTNNWVQVNKGVTNYRSLIDQIERQQKREEYLPLVTFNYDALLENALYDHGFSTKSLEDYLQSHRRYKLFKLHGSITWARAVEGLGARSATRHDLIELGASLRLSKHFKLYDADLQDMQNGVPLFPAIAIPLQSKDTFECPSEHVEWLRKLIPQVTKILFIGWRAGEAHFLRMLKEGLQKLDAIMVITGDPVEAQNLVNLLKAEFGDAAAACQGFAAGGGFSDFITGRQGDPFLKV